MNSNFHRDYKLEHPGVQMIEEDFGFVTYKKEREMMTILEVYIAPKYRGAGLAQSLFSKVRAIAKEEKCSLLLTYVDPTSPFFKPTTRSLEMFGMKCLGPKIQVPMEQYFERIS